MIGNRVKVYLVNGGNFEGTLIHKDNTGVIVHNTQGLNDIRKFFPYSNIEQIDDLGRAPSF